jgi:hypothetical protein
MKEYKVFETGIKTDSIQKTIIKMINIPWDISTKDVEEFFVGYRVDDVHIPIDKASGKTKNEVFIQLDYVCTEKILPPTLELRQGEKIKGRRVQMSISDADEMFRAHFPHSCSDRGVYLMQDEVNSLLNVCRNYKVVF